MQSRVNSLCSRHFPTWWCVSYCRNAVSGCGAQSKGWNPWCSDCGVWLGLHASNCCDCQSSSIRCSSSLWAVEHWWPNHSNQWCQSGWPSTIHMPELHQGINWHVSITSLNIILLSSGFEVLVFQLNSLSIPTSVNLRHWFLMSQIE